MVRVSPKALKARVSMEAENGAAENGEAQNGAATVANWAAVKWTAAKVSAAKVSAESWETMTVADAARIPACTEMVREADANRAGSTMGTCPACSAVVAVDSRTVAEVGVDNKAEAKTERKGNDTVHTAFRTESNFPWNRTCKREVVVVVVGAAAWNEKAGSRTSHTMASERMEAGERQMEVQATTTTMTVLP